MMTAELKLEEMEIIVDSREPTARTKDYEETYPLVQRFCPKARKGKLEIGDIGYKDLRFELKTWSDFIATIMSERFRKQLYNFLQNQEIKGYLVIHGKWSELVKLLKRYTKFKMNGILGAIASIESRYNVSVLVFPTKEYAIYTICKIIEKAYVHKEVKPIIYRRTRDERAVGMLVESADRVGEEDAMRLLLEFGTVSNVLSQSVEELTKVKYIGKTKAERILKTAHYDFKKLNTFEEDIKEDLQESAKQRESEKTGEEIEEYQEFLKKMEQHEEEVLKAIQENERENKKAVTFKALLSSMNGISKTMLNTVLDTLETKGLIYQSDQKQYRMFDTTK